MGVGLRDLVRQKTASLVVLRCIGLTLEHLGRGARRRRLGQIPRRRGGLAAGLGRPWRWRSRVVRHRVATELRRLVVLLGVGVVVVLGKREGMRVFPRPLPARSSRIHKFRQAMESTAGLGRPPFGGQGRDRVLEGSCAVVGQAGQL